MATSKEPIPETINGDNFSTSQSFWEKHSKKIIIAGSVLILAIGGWFGYEHFIKIPKENKANEALFPAENLFGKMATSGFNKDSSVIVLNGGNAGEQAIMGVLKVISNHGGTGAANRAQYIAGATYLHLKEFDKAINHLKKFDGNGADQVQAKAFIMLGHAYAEKNNTSEAFDAYKKASSVNKKDEAVTPEALLIAANYAEVTGKAGEAKSLYSELKENFPAHTSVRSGEVDKYLARLGELK